VKPNEPQPKVFYNPDRLEGLMEHMAAIYVGLRAAPQIRPDLVVGHMSYGTMLYLRNLYDCPFVGYYELLPPPFWGPAMTLRKEFPPPEGVRLFNAMYHTFTYLHLHACDAGYTPTQWQLSTAPKELQYKLNVIFDGMDVDVFQPRTLARPFRFRDLTIEPGSRVVTYVSRGLESMRGFDVFMKMAKRICAAMPNVVFLVAGDERTNYGHELHYLSPKGFKSFKQWVLSQDQYDLERIRFLGHVPPQDLLHLYNLSDLHVYLTAPYVLSWSMMQAMSSGCTILGSATPPVQEVLTHEQNGLLADFYDVDALTEQALRVLKNPDDYKHLGQAARQTIIESYEKRQCIHKLVKLFQSFGRTSADSLFEALGARAVE